MEKYNGADSSGVSAYEVLEGAIILKFANDNFFYLYDFTKPGKAHVEKMIELAIAGKGLSTYVNKMLEVIIKENGDSFKKYRLKQRIFDGSSTIIFYVAFNCYIKT